MQHRVWTLVLLLASVSAVLAPQTCRAEETDQIKKPVAESIRIRQDTQEQEQKWRDDKEKLLARYDRLEEMKKQLSERQAVLEDKVKAASGRIAAKEKQLADIEAIQRDIAPLIDSLIEDLESFVAGDLPFLAEERRTRLGRLAELRDDPEVAVSEKFRKVLEAMLVEAEYGNTIEVYRQSIALDGRETMVDVFRLGRVGLFYQTLDHASCGFYSVASSSWQPLPGEYNRAVAAAIEIGAKRRPAELLTLPLGRIQL